ncbi:MAG TPA: DUF72 domain-containing protein [Bauldia sp.]|nr:DUF72 domain-containing protein [Bauldia sp.]
MTVRIGTAGWQLGAEQRKHAPQQGTHLERYATIFNCVEITSSFYRAHQRKTYERWAGSVPAGFHFAVKVPRTITHEAKLTGAMALLDAFLEETGGLGDKRGPLIVQLAPRHIFDAAIVDAFFADFRKRYAGPITCEPRHVSWFDGEADGLLAEHRVGRVAADPALHHGAELPGGWPALAYFRWHGSPVVYRSGYDAAAIATLAERVAGHAKAWVIFDNTMLGRAFFDAVALQARLA